MCTAAACPLPCPASPGGPPCRGRTPLLQEALDGIEFISGPPNSTWGSVRAAMGRAEPWALKYVAIGNEVGWVRGWQALLG